MLSPVERSSLSDQVYQQLRDGILAERYRAGERLPSERELSETLQVNRSSVREAIKRLEQARLVEVRHGEGSIVLDFRLTAGFELLGELIMPGGSPNAVALRSVLELRALIGPEVARLAALRIQDDELERVEQLVARLEACAPEDTRCVQELDFEFHYTLVQAGENLALLLLYNSIREVYLGSHALFSGMFGGARSRELYRPLLAALRARDAKRATRAALKLMEAGNTDFLRSVGAPSEEQATRAPLKRRR